MHLSFEAVRKKCENADKCISSLKVLLPKSANRRSFRFQLHYHHGTDAAGKLASTLEKNPALKIIRENKAEYLYAPLTSSAIERLLSLVRSKQLNLPYILIENMEKFFHANLSVFNHLF